MASVFVPSMLALRRDICNPTFHKWLSAEDAVILRRKLDVWPFRGVRWDVHKVFWPKAFDNRDRHAKLIIESQSRNWYF